MMSRISTMVTTITLITIASFIDCSEHGNNNAPQEFYSIILPGQNGCGGRWFELHGVVNTANRYIKYATIENKIDLGQGNCIRHFETQFDSDKLAQEGNNILCGVSQGTATFMNWLAQYSHAEQEKRAKALVLESVLGSGNSAILHTVSTAPIIKYIPITYLPFARFWAPLLAKCVVYQRYNPYGKQVFSSVKKISPNIPIIIMHDKNDFQLSINDARETYCTLVSSRPTNRANVYLMELNDPYNAPRHFNILENCPEQQRALQAIYQKHTLPYNKELLNKEIDPATQLPTPLNLDQYQPSIDEVRTRICKSSWKSYWTRNTIDIIAASLIAVKVYQQWYKNKH